MTTIAWDGISLAGDGRVTSSSLILTDKHTKIHDAGDQLVGMAGDYAKSEEWLEAYLDGDLLEPLEEEEGGDTGFVVLLVEKDGGSVAVSYNGGPLLQVGAPFAVGSGADFAVGAMSSGKTAKQAVKLAMKYDAATGGKITVLSL